MEFVIGIAILVGVVWLLVVNARRDDVIEPFKPSAHKPKQTRATRPEPSTRRQTNRFDERGAKHLRKPRILTGAAWVTDGDTIKVQKTQIRLFGIDAPELNHPYGQKTKWALHKLCKGHTIRVEVTDVDHYGRTVAKCYLPDGRDLSAEMVKMGLAIDWPKFSGKKYSHLEKPDVRKKLFLANARQKGRMDMWHQFEDQQRRA